MASIIVGHQATERLTISRPFSGLVIAVATVLEGAPVLGTNFPVAKKINTFDINISLKNTRTDDYIFNMPLGRLFQYLNRYKLRAIKMIQMNRDQYQYTELGVSGYPNTGDSWQSMLSDYSLDFECTYDGEYELIVETKSAFPDGTRLSSFLSITPEWSDEPMEFEHRFGYDSLDKKTLTKNLGNGIEEIIIMRDMVITNDESENPTYPNFVSNIIRAMYNSSSGRAEEYNQNDLRVLTNQFYQDRVQAESVMLPMLVIHDLEVNSDLRVVVETVVPNNKDYIIYRRYVKNANVISSQISADVREEKVMDDMLTTNA